MMVRLLLLFTLVPIAELAILIRIGQVIGVWDTIALVLLTGMVGAWLAKREGLRTITGIQAELQAGRLPGDQLIDAMLIFAAGVLLVTPGVLTDVLGIILLMPPLRHFVRNALKRRFHARFMVIHPGQSTDEGFIDVEAGPSPKTPAPPRHLEQDPPATSS